MSFLRFAVETPNLELVLDKDLTEQTSQIENKIPSALSYVGAELAANLKKHLQHDWYEPYQPKQYERRTDGASPSDMSIMSDNAIFYHAERNRLQFSYNVRGVHEETYWHKRDGDKLIESIQKGIGNAPPRPFWNYFVTEAQKYLIMESFIKGMAPYEVIAADKTVSVASESELAFTSKDAVPYNEYGTTDDTDELPF